MNTHISAMNKILLTILISLLPLSMQGGTAESKQYIFQQIGVKDGLSHQVNCMAVSCHNGYVWMGTKNGIGRFDGHEQKKYLNSNISQLVEDQEHNIWVIATKGLFRYDEREDEFRQIYDEAKEPVQASSICIWDDGIWFGGFGKLYKYDYARKRIVCFRSLIPDTKYHITNLCKWDSHTLLAANRWNSSLLIDTRSGHTRPVPFDCDNLVTLFPDSKGNFWIAPYNKGVKCYNRNGQLLHSYHMDNSALQNNIILSITEYKERIWIGTDGKGICIVNPENGRMDLLSHIPGDPYSLPSNSILALYADSQSGVWAGSVRSGLFNIKEVGIKLYPDALPNMEYGLSEKSILSLYQEKGEEKIWIGTDGGGLNTFHPGTRKFHHIPLPWGGKVASITGTDRRHMVVSLFGKGLFVFDKQTELYTPLIIVNDSINAALCQQGKTVNVVRNSSRTVLLLSETPYSYDWEQKRFTAIKCDNSTGNIVGQLLPISIGDSISYLHDSRQIYRMDCRSDMLHSLYLCQGDTLINSASIDENGTIWIGSNHGLGCFSLNENRHTLILNGLADEVTSVVCDQRGRVWLGNREQLFAWSIKQEQFTLYDVPDGVMPNEYLAKPRLVSSQGDVYLGSVNGLLHISRELPEEPTTPPLLELNDIFVGGERIKRLPQNKRVLKIQEQSKPIILKITARNKDIFRKSAYRYTLQGSDRQPVYSYLPELTLNALTTGTYRVLASCSTRMGGWTDDCTILTLIIFPPWYKTGWFILFCMVLFILGVGTVIFFLIRRKENKLKWVMKEHEQQVYEEKVRFLININHELRTPLTLIHAPLKQLIEKLSPDDDKYRVLQSIVRQSDHMKKILNMVLDVRKMEVRQSTLNKEAVKLEPWIGQIVEDFKPEAELKHVTVAYRLGAEADILYCDKEKCTTVLTNLLVNALKYSDEGGEVYISADLAKERDSLRISVSDQGSGLKDVDVDKLFTRFYQGNNNRPGTGIGLSYSKILVEQHGGHIGAYDNNGTCGATFWFELPLNAQPGKQTLQPQPYLNELLASVEEVENVPNEAPDQKETENSTLLIVDDNKELTEYLVSALQGYFKEVRAAHSGEEALELCRQWHPDSVVSDIQMPRMDGYELCKRIKGDLEISHIPVILLTARSDEESRIFGYKNGADVYLTKPFEVSTLYTAIYSLLKNRERIKACYTATGAIPSPQESTFSPADEKFLGQLNTIIKENLDHPQMGVPFLCAELCISRASLYNKLKALTGMGANDYISKIRIECAAELLISTSLNINEIADRVGFSTPRYFSTVFKQSMGCSPTQYKEKRT